MINTSASTSYDPAALRAGVQLPDQDAVLSAGIELDLAPARLVLVALSWLVADGRAQTRSGLNSTIMGIVDVCRQESVHFGVVTPAPYPTLRRTRWPLGGVVLNRLRISVEDIDQAWDKTRHTADDACLPLEWVLGFFPADIWAPVATFIAWGPDTARMRMEDAVVGMTKQVTVVDRRSKPAGSPLSRSTIEHRISGVWRLMRILVDLRAYLRACPNLSLPAPLLDSWGYVPKRVNAAACGAQDNGVDTGGPSVERCSERLKELVHDLESAPPDRRYMRLRRVIHQALLPLCGSRADATRTPHVDDFLPHHVWRDGTTGPALRIYPGKTWPVKKPHYLPLPDLLADWISQWIALNGFQLGQRDVPLFPTTKPAPGKPPQSLSSPAFYQAIAGRRRASGNRGSLALMPRGDDRYVGWNPHAYRHTAYQLAVRAAIQFKQDHPQELDHIHNDEFAGALLGHAPSKDVSTTYRDVNPERLMRAVVPIMWDILWGDGSRRKGLDLERVRTARESRDLLRLQVQALEAEVRSLQAEANRLAARVGNGTSAPPALLVSALLASQQAAAKRDQRDQAAARLSDAEAALKEALETQVPLADDLTEAEYDALLADALGQPQLKPTPDDGALAATITIDDVAELWDRSPQAIRSWIRNGPPGHLPTPWFEDAWVIRTKKDRRLRISAINEAALTQVQIERLRLIRLRRAHGDAETFHPAVEITSKHDATTEETRMSDSQTTGRQMADGLVDAWQTSGTSPPNEGRFKDDEEGTS